MAEKVKPLKIEETTNGGENNFGPTETDPTEDYLAAKGIALENSDNTTISGNSGVMEFKDSEITTLTTLKDLSEKLKYKTVDLTNLVEGYVLTWNNTLSKFELLANGSASGGVVPPFIFSKDGNLTVGTYLRTGSVQTNNAGQLIRGNNKIIEIHATCGTTAGSTTRIQFFKRTAVATRSDVTNAYVDISVGNYKGSNTGLNISIGPDFEIGCYNKSGSTLQNVVVVIYLVPA